MSDAPVSFADFIRTLGRGPKRARALTLPEAEAAMTMICNGTAAPIQVGALLVLLRYRGETPEELAGLVRAVRTTVALPTPAPIADLDWPTYAAGHSRGLPWFVLSALLLACNGVRVVMHGLGGHANAADQALATLGIPTSASVADAAERLARERFAYLPLHTVCPKLHELIVLRELLGVRSAANTIARLLNPLQASHIIQGVFHPPYGALQQNAAILLQQPRLAVFKGGGGEAERPAAKPIEVHSVNHGTAQIESWPPQLDESPRRPSDSPRPLSALPALWRGDLDDAHATAVVTGSAAVALRLLDRARSTADADALAANWWHQRNRSRIPAACGPIS